MERPTSRTVKSQDSLTPTMTFVGQARLPQSCVCAGSGIVCVALEVDPASGEVMALESQGIMRSCEHLAQAVLLGYGLDRGIDGALQEIQQRLVAPPQKAVCTAIANAYEAFLRSCRH